jgi:hypothetical protein
VTTFQVEAAWTESEGCVTSFIGFHLCISRLCLFKTTMRMKLDLLCGIVV